jgi:putative hydrolase of the HAD superfamily
VEANLRLFIFDVGGVIAANTSVVPHICDYLDISQDRFIELAGHEGIQALQTGRMTEEAFAMHLSEKTGIEVPANIWSIFFSPIPIEGTVKTIEKLKTRYRVIAGTNTIDPHYRIHKSRNDYGLFDEVYASHLMGLAKPDPEFYRHILCAENCPPEEAFFVDDTLKNVLAARNLGIVSFHFTEPSALEERLKEFL